MGMRINTKLELFDYIIMVEAIAEDFFDENNQYCPHIGEINAMRLFYNTCVKNSVFDKKYGHNIVDANNMIEIVADQEFIAEYNKAISDIKLQICDFGNAYRNAMDIVETRKSSIGNATETISLIIQKISNSISSALNEESIKTLYQIGKNMLNGKITADAIVDAYKKNIKNDSTKVGIQDNIMN